MWFGLVLSVYLLLNKYTFVSFSNTLFVFLSLSLSLSPSVGSFVVAVIYCWCYLLLLLLFPYLFYRSYSLLQFVRIRARLW